ncbi:MAG: putative toxin-antitoxin system toxin component, PIN family [Bacteroidales bacterium]|nr:putative toxin-antitoxin system toxin component, PIN family [Bacteroidales bacterium]
MKHYAVFDTNVLVSAMITNNSESPTVKVMEKVAEGHIIPIYNYEIITEYNAVLHRSKFNLREHDIANMIEMILECGIPLPRTAATEEFIDTDDTVFYVVALSKEGSYLVTGNIKHFPKVPIVVTPAEMLNIVGK